MRSTPSGMLRKMEIMLRTRSAIFRGAKQPISVEETILQDPQAGEVLVRVAATGACHSDYHAVDGRNEAPMIPLVMGHEGAGVVEGIGAGVTDFAEGDHIVFAIPLIFLDFLLML